VAKRKRILFLHTGGTLGMQSLGDPGPLAPSAIAENVLPYVKGLGDLVDIHGEVLCNLDSSDLSPSHWEAIGSTIFGRRADYDGFVVLHGTDTMAYTASALSFMLEDLDRPVVLTGSQRPVVQVRTDARSNLIHSAICATLDVPEVGLYFGSVLLRGNRATKQSSQAYDAYTSPNLPPLVEMGVGIEHRTPVRRPRGPFRFRPGFDDRVAVLWLLPGSRPSGLRTCVEAGAKAVVLLGFGSGNVPQEGWPEAIADASAADVPVIIGTQCLSGAVVLERYTGGSMALQAGALSAGHMTTEATVVKTMALLHRCRNRQEFVLAWLEDLAGELYA